MDWQDAIPICWKYVGVNDRMTKNSMSCRVIGFMFEVPFCKTR